MPLEGVIDKTECCKVYSTQKDVALYRIIYLKCAGPKYLPYLLIYKAHHCYILLDEATPNNIDRINLHMPIS